jgi:hypothetical protein
MSARAVAASARSLVRRATARLADALAARNQTSGLDCPREHEVLEAIAFGRWSAGGELAAHVAACATCRDVAEVARALHDDRDAAMRDAHPPTAGIIWWRATIRARAEAAHTAMQPITVLQGIAGACVAGATAALAAAAWRWLDSADRIGDVVSRFALERGGAAASAFTFEHAMIVVCGIAACLVLAPLALYFTLADD